MRNLFRIVAVAAAIGIQACNSEEQLNTGADNGNLNATAPQPRVEITFTAGYENTTSKTAISSGDGHKLLFSSGDEFKIQDGNGEVQTCQAILPESSVQSDKCTINATFGQESSYYKAYYPASVTGSNLNKGILKNEQTSIKGTFDPQAHIMTSIAEGQNFVFETKNAFLKFTAPDYLTSVSITGNNNETIAGEFVLEDGDIMVPGTTGSKTITLTGTIDLNQTYYISLIPTTFEKGLTLTLTSKTGETKEYKVDSKVTTSANKVTKFKDLSGLYSGKFKTITVEKTAEYKALWDLLMSSSCADEVTIYMKEYDSKMEPLVTAALSTSRAKGKTIHLVMENTSYYITIDVEAYKGLENIASFIFSTSLKEIKANAFKGCTGLKEIDTKNVYSIGANAFSGCTNLEKVTTKAKTISEKAFLNCTSIKTLELGKGIETIGERAFRYCENISKITIPSGVTSIGPRAFAGCSQATELVIPKTVTSIGQSAFGDCEALEKVTIAAKDIPEYLFNGFTNIKTLVLQKGIETIGLGAFRGCSNISYIKIPSGVTSIGKYAFADCSSATEVVVPSTVTTWDTYPFIGCTGLRKATIGCKEIPIGLFENCNIKTLVLQEGVETIGKQAFFGNQITELDIPSTVTTIEKAFDYADSFKKITCRNKTIVNFAFCKAWFYSNGVSYAEIWLANTVENIEVNAFYGIDLTLPIHLTPSQKASWLSKGPSNSDRKLITDVAEK